MTETATAPAATEPSSAATVEEPFDREDIKEFSSDDVEAGRNICRMLSIFFFYTVIVMGLSTYVTYRWVFGD